MSETEKPHVIDDDPGDTGPPGVLPARLAGIDASLQTAEMLAQVSIVIVPDPCARLREYLAAVEAERDAARRQATRYREALETIRQDYVDRQLTALAAGLIAIVALEDGASIGREREESTSA